MSDERTTDPKRQGFHGRAAVAQLKQPFEAHVRRVQRRFHGRAAVAQLKHVKPDGWAGDTLLVSTAARPWPN